MTQRMSEYHEPVEELDADARDAHRALVSLQEEIEAVDWYNQRRICCRDPELARVLEHNRDEEMEHAAMLVEWLRRKMGGWDQRLKQQLFTTRALGPEADEHAIARAMRRAAPHAYPNRRIVALADDMLGRRGKMVDAVEAMGGDSYVSVGAPFDFSVRHR